MTIKQQFPQQVQISRETHKRIKIKAAMEGISLYALIDQILKDYLDTSEL